ncbi:MAG: hypothetical protein JWN69_782 [Alphaproteobacteria bacterium]|nr:hypothetical protein [Alphaproteobacteria bacterium]
MTTAVVVLRVPMPMIMPVIMPVIMPMVMPVIMPVIMVVIVMCHLSCLFDPVGKLATAAGSVNRGHPCASLIAAPEWLR